MSPQSRSLARPPSGPGTFLGNSGWPELGCPFLHTSADLHSPRGVANIHGETDSSKPAHSPRIQTRRFVVIFESSELYGMQIVPCPRATEAPALPSFFTSRGSYLYVEVISAAVSDESSDQWRLGAMK
jgi:hypothetical protein